MHTIYDTLVSYFPTASAEASGYPDDNLSHVSVRRSWRSNALSNSPWTVTLNLGAATATAGIIVWDTNIPASGIAVHHSPDNSNWTALSGTLTVAENAGGRRVLMIATGLTKQYWRLTITAASTSDGADYVEVGRIAVFANSGSYPVTNPLDMPTIRPGVNQRLLNGQYSFAETGEEYVELTISVDGWAYGTYDMEALRRKFMAGPCVTHFETFGPFLVTLTSESTGRAFNNTTGAYSFRLCELV